MYGNNYPNDYEDKNVIDSTAREVNHASNGNFSGNFSGQSAAGGFSGHNPSGSSTAGSGSYQYSSGCGGNRNDGKIHGQEGKDGKGKKSGGFLKRAAAVMALGLFFGACAGAGFYAVELSLGHSGEKMQAEARTEPEASDETEGAIAKEAAESMEVVSTVVADGTGTAGSAGAVLDVSDVAARVMPAIVSINNTTTKTISYFGRRLQSEAVGAGSGIIVGQSDTELLIVSNYHVVEDSDKLVVQFADGTEAEAQMKGSDPDMDLAVIAVSLTDVEAATKAAIAVAALGDSDTLVVGEPAIAIGNALGYGQSVTTGVISAVNRVIDLSSGDDLYSNAGSGYAEDEAAFIQTDAAINPGNSGGALLNIKGEVIGINSNKIGGSAVEGMGYAIPISAAKPIIEELMLRETRSKVGEENKGYLGVFSLTVVDQMAQDYGMPKGAYVSEVIADSAAEKAGIIKGNIITEFGGNKISSAEDLLSVMEYYAAGDVVEVVVMQGSPSGWESKKVVVILGERTE